MLASSVQQWFKCVCVYVCVMYTPPHIIFPCSFPLQVTTRYWGLFPVLYVGPCCLPSISELRHYLLYHGRHNTAKSQSSWFQSSLFLGGAGRPQGNCIRWEGVWVGRSMVEIVLYTWAACQSRYHVFYGSLKLEEMLNLRDHWSLIDVSHIRFRALTCNIEPIVVCFSFAPPSTLPWSQHSPTICWLICDSLMLPSHL